MTASAGPALRALYDHFGGRVAFVSLYVREARPGENFPQPAAFEEKLKHARSYKERDTIPWPVAVDDINGTLHRTLDSKPHAAYIMDINGKVAFRSLWANDERTLRSALEGISADPEKTIGERQPKVVAMLMGLGEFYEVLADSGDVARKDLLREIPPMYATARLADLFRPLSPLGRGVAAVATVVAVLAVGAMMLRRLFPQ